MSERSFDTDQTRARIQAAKDDIAGKLLNIPAWGGVDLLVRSPRGQLRDRIMAAIAAGAAVGDKAQVALAVLSLRMDIIIACTFDPHTQETVFADEDREWLADKDPTVLDRLFYAALDLGGISETGAREVEGNSESTPSDSTTSC